MKNFRNILPALFCLGIVQISPAQKKLSDFSIAYDFTITPKGGPASMALNGTNTIYIKGNMTRSEMNGQSFISTTIQDATTGAAVILKEVSGQKILIRLSAENWRQMNAASYGISFINTEETKTIAGYKCNKATAKTQDGSDYSVYYAAELVVDNKEYNPKFKNLAGLPLEFEMSKNGVTIKYTVSKINLNPVPASKFDIPKSGYREMTYDDSKKLKTGE
jgi:GLPGLI family protein